MPKFPAPCKQTFSTFSAFTSFFTTQTFSLVTVTDSLSENFQFYTVLHYWHLLYRKKINGKLEYVTCKVQKSMESWCCFILLFSHDHEVLYELPREWTNKICEDTSSVYKLQVLVCHTVYQPCLPESAISWVHSLLKAAQLLCRPRAVELKWGDIETTW